MKKFLIIFSFIISSLVAALISVPYWLDVNDYKPEISSFIKQKTGYNVDISGQITLHILPDISLNITGVKASTSVDAKSLFSTSELILQVKLIPLIQKKIEVESFKLTNPDIYLHIKQDGKTNWVAQKTEPKKKDAEDTTLDEKGAKEINISSSLEENTPKISDLLQFKEFKIENASITFKDDVKSITTSVSNLNVDTSLSEELNPFTISGKLNIFEDPAKGYFNIDGKFQLHGNGYSIDDMSIIFDDIKGNSNIALDPYGFKPTVNVALYFSDTDLNGYKLAIKNNKNADSSTTSSQEERSKTTTTNQGTWNEEPINLSILNEYDGHFSFKAKSIYYNQINTEAVELNAFLRNNKLSYNIKEINIYGGKITGEGIVNNSGGPIGINGDIKLSNIDLEKLPKEISFVKSAQGKINSNLILSTSGHNVTEFVSNLNGKTKFVVSEGVLEGVDFFSMVNNVTAAFNIGSLSNKTRFEEISATFDAEKGVLHNDDLILKSDLINFTGEGDINLNDLNVNYKLTPKYSQDFSKDTQKPIIPIMITGPISQPIFRLEVKSIVKDLINNPKGAENLVNQLKDDFKNLKNNFTGESGIKTLKELKNIFKQ